MLAIDDQVLITGDIMDLKKEASMIAEVIVKDVKKDIFIQDNHRIVHGRTAFNQAHSGSADRHIMRLYATTREQGTEAG